ncbi:hypothetical protein MIU24_14180 [Streptomyces venezuelae]
MPLCPGVRVDHRDGLLEPLPQAELADFSGMFSLAAPDRVRTVLPAAGFTRIAIAETRAYGTWGKDATDAADFLRASGPGRHLMDNADEPARVRARAALTDHLRAHETDDRTVRLVSTACLVTAERP